MSIIPGIQHATNALTTERLRMEVSAENLANQHTTRGPDGKAYRRKQVVFEAALDQASGGMPGLRTARIVQDEGPQPRVYRPGHPHADANGMVTLPNVEPAAEMADLMTAGRAYEANVQVIVNARQMLSQLLRIGR
jgi:flagellar basal-body rod protein FlgC